MSEWQPIETAPKDRLILAGWFNSLGKWRSEHGRYYGPRELPLDDYALEDSENDEDYAPAGWYGGGLECERLYDIRPTHWMPLPQPPGAQSGQGNSRHSQADVGGTELRPPSLPVETRGGG